MSLRDVRSARISTGASSSIVEKLARARINIRTAAGRDHPDIALIHQACNEAPLAIAKVVFAVALEDFGRRESSGILDRCVAVDELQAETPG